MRAYSGRAKLWVVALVAVYLCASLGLGLRPRDLAALIDAQALTFEGALRVAERLDAIADDLEVLPLGRSPADIELLVVEIVQYFSYEGISDRCYLPAVQYRVYTLDRAFHVAGSCTIGIRPSVYLNFRYSNPWSVRWYNREDLLAVLVHELGHAQGISGSPFAPDNWIEPATQLATVEVLAAMVRDQNPHALLPLLRELQDYAEYYAMEIALREGRMDEYRAHVRRVADSAYEVASFERSMDHWRTNMPQLRDILTNYGKWPWVLLVAALHADGFLTRPFDCVPNDTGRIKMDDLAYVLEHLDALVRDYREVYSIGVGR